MSWYRISLFWFFGIRKKLLFYFRFLMITLWLVKLGNNNKNKSKKKNYFLILFFSEILLVIFTSRVFISFCSCFKQQQQKRINS